MLIVIKIDNGKLKSFLTISKLFNFCILHFQLSNCFLQHWHETKVPKHFFFVFRI